MPKAITGYIHSIESFGAVDGPGVRFIVFMQGCPMRCEFCHNPDTWKIRAGNKRTTDDLLAEAIQYKSYWGKKGGITISGGEPLLQMDFLNDFFSKAKKAGVHMTLDTCGQSFTRKEPFFSQFEKLMTNTDLILLDIKHIDSEAHRRLTGHSNENILDLAKYLSEINKPVWIRHVLIPERTDCDDSLIRLDAFIQTLSNVDKVEVLPYHVMGIYKWAEIGKKYPLEGIDPPTKERIANANRLLHTNILA